jgi:hypothetical protein
MLIALEPELEERNEWFRVKSLKVQSRLVLRSPNEKTEDQQPSQLMV